MEDVNFSCRNLFHWWLLGGLSSLSGWTGHDVRPVQCPFFPLVSFCPLLLDWKHVQLSHHSVSATISLSPRLKKKKSQRGRQEKWLALVSQDLCQKCFSPQVICYSPGSFHCLLQRVSTTGSERERERNEREKNDIELWVVTDLHSLVGTCRVSEECLCADADCLPSAAVFKSD